MSDTFNNLVTQAAATADVIQGALRLENAPEARGGLERSQAGNSVECTVRRYKGTGAAPDNGCCEHAVE